MATRTQNAKRNIITSVINKLVIMLTNFIMRTVLIWYLGRVYLGLDSLFTSILQILSLTELGIGSAMVYSMYKPLAENDTPTMCALLKLYRTVYRWIALIMTVLGAAITPILPLIVKNDLPDGLDLYALYFINLGNTVLSYLLFAYRSALFTADQRYSINNNIYSVFKVGTTVMQIVAILLLKDHEYVAYYFYSLALPVTTVLKNLVTYRLSQKMYPQYQCEGKVSKAEIDGIKKRVAGMFLHKVSFVFRNSLDSIVISAFLGLEILGQYNSYYFIINAVSGIMILVSNSVTASVGNSMVVETKEKNYADFKKIQLLYMWLTSWLTVCFAACLQPFIELWLGKDMLFSDAIMAIFCVYFFSIHFSRVCPIYRDAAGLWWQDRYRPVVETVVNFSLNVLLVKFVGVSGVMLSTIFCIVFIEGTWGTRVLFKYYFTQEKQSTYMLKLLWTWTLTGISCGICYVIYRLTGLGGIPAILAYGVLATVVSNAVYALGNRFLPEYRSAVTFALKLTGIGKLRKKS